MAKHLQVIDLFSGVGGLSFSAVKAGFNLAGAVEFEQRAIDSHARNFPNSKHLCKDISKLTGKDLAEEFKINGSGLAGLIGGPPCQGFSTIGKREVGDKRNNLFSKFFKLAAELQPAFYIAENVPGILNEQYDKVRSSAFKLVENDYEILKPIKLSAKDLGAATSRTRVFFIGVRKDIKGGHDLAGEINSLVTPNFTYVESALEGLPENVSDNWLDFEDSWQRISFSKRNQYVVTLNEILDGVGDEAAIKRFLKHKEVSGCFGTLHSKEVANRYKNLKPGEQDKISKSQKLKLDGFCPTLRAGTDSSKGSYQAVRPIHPTQARVITPREAARLQGFPDWFQFHETKWHSFRQIGNSVCPIVGQQVLATVKNTLSI